MFDQVLIYKSLYKLKSFATTVMHSSVVLYFRFSLCFCCLHFSFCRKCFDYHGTVSLSPSLFTCRISACTNSFRTVILTLSSTIRRSLFVLIFSFSPLCTLYCPFLLSCLCSSYLYANASIAFTFVCVSTSARLTNN